MGNYLESRADGLPCKETGLALARRALQRIANGRKGPRSQRISAEESRRLARGACDVIGWPYDNATAQDAENES